jgi:membrane fusion protein
MTAQQPSDFDSQSLGLQPDHADVIDLSLPLTWRVALYSIAAVVFSVFAVLLLGSYSRVQSAAGVVIVDKGVASVHASRAGVVQALFVREGQEVRSGDRLALISAEDQLIGGKRASGEEVAALELQRKQLTAQAQSVSLAAQHEQEALREDIRGLQQVVKSLGTQISEQERLIRIAAADYARAKEMAAHGFVSKRDLDSRDATLISYKQNYENLMQTRAAKGAEIQADLRSIERSAASASAQVGALNTSRAELLQQLAQAQAAKGYIIAAPTDGQVTAVTARPGQRLTPEQQLMMVLPAQSHIEAELYVTPKDAGMLREGQSVQVAVDAFPYQTFGTVTGRIVSISHATILKDGPSGPSPVYLVTIRLPKPWIEAYGRHEPLRVGMTVTARIIVAKRSLLNWIFEPLFAVSRR